MTELNRIFVRPAAPGLLVRKPIGGHLAAEGEAQNDESYWRRRELDGDVVITEVAAEPTEATGAEGGAKAADASAAEKVAPAASGRKR